MYCTAPKRYSEMRAKAWLKYKKVELLPGLFSYFCICSVEPLVKFCCIIQIPAFQLWNHISLKHKKISSWLSRYGIKIFRAALIGQLWTGILATYFLWRKVASRERVTLPAQSSVYSNIQEKRWPLCASQEMTISVFPMKIELVHALILSFQAQLGESKWM